MATPTTQTTSSSSGPSSLNPSVSAMDVQKLKTITEKLRMELTKLREALTTEKNSVRELKAQNERERRAHKSEIALKERQFRNQLNEQLSRKNHNANKNEQKLSSKCAKCANEHKKFVQEKQTFKDINRELEERIQCLQEADRLKANNLRTQHETHLNEISRLERSSRLETQKLLEELKTKDRLIDQLRQAIRNKKVSLSPEIHGNCNSSHRSLEQTNETMRKLMIMHTDNDEKSISPTPNSASSAQIKCLLSPLEVGGGDNVNAIKNEPKMLVIDDVGRHQLSEPKSSDTVEMTINNNIKNRNKNANADERDVFGGLASTVNDKSNCGTVGEIVFNSMPPAATERLHGQMIEENQHELQEEKENRNNSRNSSTIHNNELTISQDESSKEETTNKHRKELYYRPFDLEPVIEEDTDSAVSSAPSSLSPQPFHHHHPLHHIGKSPSPPATTQTNTTSTTSYSYADQTTPKNSTTANKTTPFITNSSMPVAPTTNFPPTSLSPQPSDDYISPSPTNYSSSPITCPSSPQPPDVWLRTTSSSPSTPNADNFRQPLLLDNTVDMMNKGELQSELAIAKRQVRELERALLVTREVKPNYTTKPVDIVHFALTERIRRLEEREASLLAELQELRDQNELQEFRILELEESQEKWSLRSQSSSELRDMGTSQVSTSLLSQDLLEYKGDVVREHLIIMARKCTDTDDKHCLQQVLNLLDNLESLSLEHASCLEDLSGDFYSGNFLRNDSRKSASRAVATVLPFMDCGPKSILDLSHTDDELSLKLGQIKKKQLSNASSLQESGIFEGDLLETHSISTQTDFTSDCSSDIKLSELTAEIQKLNQIRESIEEGKSKKFNGPTVQSSQKFEPSPNKLKEIDFYKNRVEVLENKIAIYESSGDEQLKKLKERLNREIILTSQVKDLNSNVEKLVKQNKKLEEECCELEEAENDTRLRCQQLELEMELMSERLRDVEEARSANKRKAKDAKAWATHWETMVNKYEERNYELEERETELQFRVDSLENIIPIVTLFNIWKIFNDSYRFNSSLKLPITDNMDREKNVLEEKLKSLEEKYKKVLEELEEMNQKGDRKSPFKELDYKRKIQELHESNKELKRQVEQLEQREVAYIETLQQADNIWAEMESDYKKRIQIAEDNEAQLRIKVRHLEEVEIKLRKADVPLHERISELEDIEKKLEDRVHFFEKEHKFLSKENIQMKDELNHVRVEWKNMKEHLDGPINSELERQRKRLRQLQEEIEISTRLLEETEDAHQKEISILKMQLNKTNKELVHLDVTNSEMREEIAQLEKRIGELQTAILEQRIASDRTIKTLTAELTQRDRQCLFRKRSFGDSKIVSLRDELVQKSSTTISTAQEPNDDGLNLMVHATTT